MVVMTVAMAQVGYDLTQPFMALYVRYLGVTDLAEAALLVRPDRGGRPARAPP